MFDYLQFEQVSGKKTKKDLIFFSLSTCGFCRRAKAYLNTLNLSYRILEADELDPAVKNKMKKEFRESFGEAMHFPTMIIDEKTYLVGFIKPHWELELEDICG